MVLSISRPYQHQPHSENSSDQLNRDLDARKLRLTIESNIAIP